MPSAHSPVLLICSPIALETNALWTAPDAEFTSSSHMLSAVWPSLRHGEYRWKILSDAAIERWGLQAVTGPELTYETYECTDPEVLKCGSNNVSEEMPL